MSINLQNKKTHETYKISFNLSICFIKFLRLFKNIFVYISRRLLPYFFPSLGTQKSIIKLCVYKRDLHLFDSINVDDIVKEAVAADWLVLV